MLSIVKIKLFEINSEIYQNKTKTKNNTLNAFYYKWEKRSKNDLIIKYRKNYFFNEDFLVAVFSIYVAIRIIIIIFISVIILKQQKNIIK